MPRTARSHRIAIAAAAALAASAAAVPSAALADDSDLPDKGPCQMHVKRSYRGSAVLPHGLRLKITCSEPARFFVGADFEDERSGDWVRQHFGAGGDPGAEGTLGPLRAQAGTHTYTMRFKDYARKMSQAIPRIRMGFAIGFDYGDGRLAVGPKDWEDAVLRG